MSDVPAATACRLRTLIAFAIYFAGCGLGYSDTFEVCWLPVDYARQIAHFCPTGRSPTPGAVCQCDLQSVTLEGHIGSLEVLGTSEANAGLSTVCLLASNTKKYSTTFCPSVTGSVGAECYCAGDPQARSGQIVLVQMLHRYFLRGNSAAEADFLKRLRECCVVK